MAQKRDSYEDDSDDEPDKIKIFDKITLVTGIVFIILGELFLYLLSVKTGSTFAMKEILFGLMSGISLTLFLIWIKYIMAGNKHLGGILGVGGIIAVSYAVTRKYQGAYTTTFISMGAIIALGYMIYYFIKSDNK
jgi:hypothetical protein